MSLLAKILGNRDTVPRQPDPDPLLTYPSGTWTTSKISYSGPTLTFSSTGIYAPDLPEEEMKPSLEDAIVQRLMDDYDREKA